MIRDLLSMKTTSHAPTNGLRHLVIGKHGNGEGYGLTHSEALRTRRTVAVIRD